MHRQLPLLGCCHPQLIPVYVGHQALLSAVLLSIVVILLSVVCCFIVIFRQTTLIFIQLKSYYINLSYLIIDLYLYLSSIIYVLVSHIILYLLHRFFSYIVFSYSFIFRQTTSIKLNVLLQSIIYESVVIFCCSIVRTYYRSIFVIVYSLLLLSHYLVILLSCYCLLC